jgi:hypothetical protein
VTYTSITKLLREEVSQQYTTLFDAWRSPVNNNNNKKSPLLRERYARDERAFHGRKISFVFLTKMEGKKRREHDETKPVDTKEMKITRSRNVSHIERFNSTPYSSNIFGIEVIEENTRIIGDFILQYINMPNIEVYIYI